MRKAIFIGNPLFLEDKICLVIGKMLEDKLKEKGFDVEIVEEWGFNLLDVLIEADELVIVDTVYTNQDELCGEVFKLDVNSLHSSTLKVSHTISLKDILQMVLSLKRISKITLIGIGIRDLETLSEDLSECLKNKLNYIASKVIDIIKEEYQ
jgi:Ni,Fe-hydrogenase maturation factor